MKSTSLIDKELFLRSQHSSMINGLHGRYPTYGPVVRWIPFLLYEIFPRSFCFGSSFFNIRLVLFVKACKAMGFITSIFFFPNRGGNWIGCCIPIFESISISCTVLPDYWIFEVLFRSAINFLILLLILSAQLSNTMNLKLIFCLIQWNHEAKTFLVFYKMKILLCY